VSSYTLVVLCRGSLPGGLPQELLSTGMRFWAASIAARQAADQERHAHTALHL